MDGDGGRPRPPRSAGHGLGRAGRPGAGRGAGARRHLVGRGCRRGLRGPRRPSTVRRPAGRPPDRRLGQAAAVRAPARTPGSTSTTAARRGTPCARSRRPTDPGLLHQLATAFAAADVAVVAATIGEQDDDAVDTFELVTRGGEKLSEQRPPGRPGRHHGRGRARPSAVPQRAGRPLSRFGTGDRSPNRYAGLNEPDTSPSYVRLVISASPPSTGVVVPAPLARGGRTSRRAGCSGHSAAAAGQPGGDATAGLGRRRGLDHRRRTARGPGAPGGDAAPTSRPGRRPAAAPSVPVVVDEDGLARRDGHWVALSEPSRSGWSARCWRPPGTASPGTGSWTPAGPGRSARAAPWTAPSGGLRVKLPAAGGADPRHHRRGLPAGGGGLPAGPERSLGILG